MNQFYLEMKVDIQNFNWTPRSQKQNNFKGLKRIELLKLALKLNLCLGMMQICLNILSLELSPNEMHLEPKIKAQEVYFMQLYSYLI